MEYTKITVEELLQKFRERLNNKQQFKQIQDSAIYEKFIEMLGDCCNVSNFYAQRVAEEAWINTAKTESNVIKHCQNYGYQPRRPIPAQAELIIRLKGPLPDELNQAGIEIFFSQAQTSLSYNDFNFMLDSSYSYVFSQEDIDYGHDPDWHKDLIAAVPHNQSVFMPLQGVNFVNTSNSVPIKCFQGELKTYEIQGINVLQKIGKPNQTYNIDDKSFCDWYGIRDPFAYNGDRNFVQKNSWCKVGIGESIEDAFSSEKLFDVETQSIRLNKKYRLIEEKDSDDLYNDIYELVTYNKTLDTNYKENKLKSILNKQLKICLITSNCDESVKLTFGSSHNVVNGLMKPSENLYVQYISTTGKAANQIGITGSVVKNNNSIYASANGNVINLTNNVEFILNSDIFGGDNFESMASMKVNGPGYFTRRNKLIMVDDFKNYLGNLTSPMYVNTAYVAGQQELEQAHITNTDLPLLQNYIVYSLLGKLYMQNEGNYEPRNVLTGNDTQNDPFTLYGNNYLSHIADYAKLLVSPISYAQYQYSTTFGESWVKYAQIIRENCKDNLPMNTLLLSIPPFIHYFDLVGNVKVKPSTNLEEYTTRLKNKVYKYLDELSYSTNKIYKSDLIKIYMDDPDTEFADLDIKLASIIQSDENKYTWRNNKPNEGEPPSTVKDITKWTPSSFCIYLDKTLQTYQNEVDIYNANNYVKMSKDGILPPSQFGWHPFNVIKINRYDAAGKGITERLIEKSRLRIDYTFNQSNISYTKFANCTTTSDDKYIYIILPIVFNSPFVTTTTTSFISELSITIKGTEDFVSTSKLSGLRYAEYKIPLTEGSFTNPTESVMQEITQWLTKLQMTCGADRAIDLPYEIRSGIGTVTRYETVTRRGNVHVSNELTLSEASFWTYFVPYILDKYYVSNGKKLLNTYTSLNSDVWIGASLLIYDIYTLLKPGICDSILDDYNNIVNYSLDTETSVIINKVNVYST